MIARYLALAGLAFLMGLLMLPSPSAWTTTISIPLALLFVTGLKPPPRWGGWVATAMIPYFCVAIGELIANPKMRLTSALIVGSSVVIIFAALDFVRRTGVSLRR
jgi:uncharacterized membrane protein